MSTNSAIENAGAEFEKRCAGAMPPFREMHQGFGTLRISWTTKFDYKDAVLFKEEWVLPPKGLKKKIAEYGDDQIVSKQSWVRVEDVIEYLRGQVAAKNKRK